MFDLGLKDEESSIQIAEDNSAAIAQAASGIRAVRKANHYEVRFNRKKERKRNIERKGTEKN